MAHNPKLKAVNHIKRKKNVFQNLRDVGCLQTEYNGQVYWGIEHSRCWNELTVVSFHKIQSSSIRKNLNKTTSRISQCTPQVYKLANRKSPILS